MPKSTTPTLKSAHIITATKISYGQPSLINEASFNISSSGVSAIMGPNGAGKSLLLRLIAKLIKPTSGTLEFLKSAQKSNPEIAIVFQKPVLLRRSVRANLEHALNAVNGNDKDKTQIKNQIDELLRQAQLSEIADRPARVLSGGEQQRLALVRALASNPKILLLDEATASLDPSATALIEKIIKDTAKNDTKIIMITHDFGQAKRLSNDIIFMAKGKVLEQQKTSDFFKKPITKQAKAYLDGKLVV
ncbi:MAG: ATP-binding cassette domain-containing protein [Nitratireductor sp.]